jgi:hypothetical protein
VASPAYPVRHSGTVLVCGFAACLWDDLSRAGGEAHPIIAINDASLHLPSAFAIFSFHYEAEKLGLWARERKAKHDGSFSVHAPGKEEWQEHNQRNYPHVDHWWHGVVSRGGSAWCAVRMAKQMGFERIILCGSPIDHSNYADGRGGWYWTSSHTNAVEQFRKAIAADTEYHRCVRSMSGWTKELLGEPEWL